MANRTAPTPRTWRAQKAALTRAVKSGDPSRVLAECERVTGTDWTPDSPHTPYWPDDWRRWLRALEDAYAPAQPPRDPFGGAC